MEQYKIIKFEIVINLLKFFHANYFIFCFLYFDQLTRYFEEFFVLLNFVYLSYKLRVCLLLRHYQIYPNLYVLYRITLHCMSCK